MTPVLYFAQVSLYAAAMWSIYFIVWRNRPLHTCSRAHLLAGLVLPVILPFIHIPVSRQSATAGYRVLLPEIGITSARVVPSANGVSWPDALAWLYIAGCVLLTALYVRAYIRLNKKLRQGHRIQYNGRTIIIDTGIGPGTLGHRIFFPSVHVDGIIVRHEQAHIHAGHRYDALLLQVLHVLFWVSPAHWLLGQELKTVHEFEADRIASEGVDEADYASLLVSQSFGRPHSYAIAHSFFHHPLKRRIMMLQKMKAPKRSILLLAALVLTAGFMSTVLLAQTRKPVKSKSVSQPASTAAVIDIETILRNRPPKPGEIMIPEDGTIVFRTVEQMPAFDGNLREWLIKNLHYPDSARAHSEQGSTLVQFTVDENGQIIKPRLQRSSGHQLLDDEAMRVVRSMPNWKPGMQKGKTVAVLFVLPVYFNLKGEGC